MFGPRKPVGPRNVGVYPYSGPHKHGWMSTTYLIIQTKLDYPDLDFPNFSIIRSFLSGPKFFMNFNKNLRLKTAKVQKSFQKCV